MRNKGDHPSAHVQERIVHDFLNGAGAIKNLAHSIEDRRALARAARIIVRRMLEELEEEKRMHRLTYGKASPFSETDMSDSLRRRLTLIPMDSTGRTYREIHFLQEEMGDTLEEDTAPPFQDELTLWETFVEIAEDTYDVIAKTRTRIIMATSAVIILVSAGIYALYDRHQSEKYRSQPQEVQQDTSDKAKQALEAPTPPAVR